MINKRSFGLDLLRAIAISLVLLAHFVKAFDKLGFWGVELFFGSGFKVQCLGFMIYDLGFRI
jgi:peptidoglycan/LPS O-acetylase OafA/YrhL